MKTPNKIGQVNFYKLVEELKKEKEEIQRRFDAGGLTLGKFAEEYKVATQTMRDALVLAEIVRKPRSPQLELPLQQAEKIEALIICVWRLAAGLNTRSIELGKLQ